MYKLKSFFFVQFVPFETEQSIPETTRNLLLKFIKKAYSCYIAAQKEFSCKDKASCKPKIASRKGEGGNRGWKPVLDTEANNWPSS